MLLYGEGGREVLRYEELSGQCMMIFTKLLNKNIAPLHKQRV